jgi:hypothetical protein
MYVTRIKNKKFEFRPFLTQNIVRTEMILYIYIYLTLYVCVCVCVGRVAQSV